MKSNNNLVAMNNLKVWSKNVPYIIYTFWVLLYHKYMNLSMGDDSYFSTILNESNLFDWLTNTYNNMNARIGINLMLALITRNTFIFLILDVIINVSIMYIIVKLIKLKSLASRILLLSLLLMFNIHDMSSAGWMATMVNYMWVLFSILIMATLLKKYYFEGYCSYLLPSAILVICFAGFQEQANIILLTMILFFIYAFYQRFKTIDNNALIFLSLVIVILLVLLFSPGNANKAFVGMNMNNEWSSPLYMENHFFDKVWLGIIRFNALFLAAPQIANHSNFMSVPDHHMTYAFALLLLTHYFCLSGEKVKQLDAILAATPILVLLCYLLSSYFPFFTYVFSQPGMPFLIDYTDWSFYSPVIFSILFVVSYVTYIYRNFDRRNFVISFVLLLSGLATQVMMGLSPTIYLSGARTSIFMYFSLLFLALFLYKDIESKKFTLKTTRYVTYCLITFLLFVSFYDCFELFVFLAPRGY